MVGAESRDFVGSQVWESAFMPELAVSVSAGGLVIGDTASVEGALREGADAVLVTGCGDGDCSYRLGNRWVEQRLAGAREPHLRASVPAERVHIAWIGHEDGHALVRAIGALRDAAVHA